MSISIQKKLRLLLFFLVSFSIVHSQNLPKMSIGTNFWNMAWSPSTEYFIPGIDWSDTTLTDIWNPVFLEEISMYESLRFMDWGEINHCPMVEWTDRTLPHEEQGRPDGKRKGMAYEWMIDLCNRLDADAWFCMPHAASDDYMRQFAILVRETLDTNLRIYVELSNEVWNFKTQQNYAKEQGKILNLEPPNNPTDEFGTAMRWQAYRSAQMWKIWEEEFAGDTERLINVLAGWSTNPWNAENLHLEPIFEEPLFNPTNVYPEVYAIAPYFGGNGLDGGDADIWDLLYTDIFEHRWNKPGGSSRLKNVIDHYNIVHERFGIDLIAYEGGQHLLSGATAPNRDPRMYDIYTRYLDTLQYYITHFSHYVHLGSFSNSGCWGAMEKTGQSIETAHKYRALVDYINRNRPPVYNYIPEYDLVGIDQQHEITLFGINDNNQNSNQHISIVAVSSDTSKLTDPTVLYDGEDMAILKINPKLGEPGTFEVNITLSDDGGTENDGIDKIEYTVKINLYNAWNNKPTIDSIPAVQMLEDQEKKVVITGLSDGDDGDQNLSFSAGSVMGKFENPFKINYDGSDTAELFLVPASNKNGADRITIDVKDDGGNDQNNGDQTATRDFLVEIIPVNDPPEIKSSSTPFEIFSGSGEQEITLEGIGDGDAEADQEVTVTVEDYDPAFFEQIEVLEVTSSTKRLLKMTLAEGVTGNTTVGIKLQDNGGTENGGIDATMENYEITVKTSSVAKSFNEDIVQMYPVYASKVLRVELSNKKKFMLSIIDISGKHIKGWEILNPPEKVDLDISSLKPGIYISSFKNEEKVLSKKIVVQ